MRIILLDVRKAPELLGAACRWKHYLLYIRHSLVRAYIRQQRQTDHLRHSASHLRGPVYTARCRETGTCAARRLQTQAAHKCVILQIRKPSFADERAKLYKAFPVAFYQAIWYH